MPITATRLPVRSTEWSQRAEWKSVALKVSMPSMSGSFGSDRPPAPRISVVAVSVRAPVGPVTCTVQRPAASSQEASSNDVSKTNRSSVPDRSATPRM